MKTTIRLNENESRETIMENRIVEPIPDWALGYLINGDPSGLEDEDIEMIDDWQRRSGIGTVVCPNDDDEPYFTSHPAFGKACDVYDCVCVY